MISIMLLIKINLREKVNKSFVYFVKTNKEQTLPTGQNNLKNDIKQTIFVNKFRDKYDE